MYFDVQPEPHEAHGSTPELGQRESEHPLLIQPTSPSSNKVSRSGSQVQSQPQPCISDEEERKLPPGLEVISTSSHRSEEQPDEPLGIFEPRPLTALAKATQENAKGQSNEIM
ncbi:hypothetical protein H9L39_17101 [Fusarium oxysporum f. sp. albedinis]|nr:hypothetical protein FocnCong_v020254 [Fusarium oxysporum f. sp. conglutinans]KAH7459187.1 hypothetical protein FOMA001_g20199 [Fusarium oxysporum f. sp. matthiolae]KAK2470870.1 hypothetical protein H9L39_17101 [Fusarium oxysporum f. sp. albedinis]